MFQIAKQTRKERKDVVGSKYVRDELLLRKLWKVG